MGSSIRSLEPTHNFPVDMPDRPARDSQGTRLTCPPFSLSDREEACRLCAYFACRLRCRLSGGVGGRKIPLFWVRNQQTQTQRPADPSHALASTKHYAGCRWRGLANKQTNPELTGHGHMIVSQANWLRPSTPPPVCHSPIQFFQFLV